MYVYVFLCLNNKLYSKYCGFILDSFQPNVCVCEFALVRLRAHPAFFMKCSPSKGIQMVFLWIAAASHLCVCVCHFTLQHAYSLTFMYLHHRFFLWQ